MSTFVFSPRRGSRRWAALALAAVLAGEVTACAGEEEVPAVEEAATVPAEVPAPAPAPSVSAPPEEGEVGILLAEWDLKASEDTVPAGPTTFVVHNAGSIEHAFEIEGQGIEKETEHLQPGATVTLTADLEPGRYTLYCPVEMEVNHRTEGMVTTLYVRE